MYYEFMNTNILITLICKKTIEDILIEHYKNRTDL